MGHEVQAAARPVGDDRPDESVLAQDSAVLDVQRRSGSACGTNRLFTDAKVGCWGFDWPMVPAVDWRQAPPRIDTATNIKTGAGWLAGDRAGRSRSSATSRSSLTATYYLPDKTGNHDFKCGDQYVTVSRGTVNNGNSGPIQYRDRNGAHRRDRGHRLRTSRAFGDRLDRARQSQQELTAVLPGSLEPGGQPDVPGAACATTVSAPHYEASMRNPVLTEIFPARDRAGAELVQAQHDRRRASA